MAGEITSAGPAPAMGPGRRVVFRADHKSFGEFIRSEQMRDVTEEVAKDIASRAGDLAPRRKSRGRVPDGAAMADSFRVNKDAGFIKVERNVRVKVEVYNNSRSAAPNEFGSSKNPRHRMLARAGAEYGDFKPDGGEV
jgi:hypothetical protein